MIVVFTATAEADLEAIGDYIAQNNPIRALSFVQEISRSCLELADMAEAWPVIPHPAHMDIRRRLHGRYLIFYRVSQGRIVILHILNGARDVDAILFPNR